MAASRKIPSTKVELAVSCRNLQDKDILSKSDPICVLYTKEFGQQNWVEANSYAKSRGLTIADVLQIIICIKSMMNIEETRELISGIETPFKGRTEIIWNDLNPNFVTKFVLDYYFEQKQYLLFKLYDVDSDTPDLSTHDFLGQMKCTLAKIVCCMKIEESLEDESLKDDKDIGKIIVTSEKQNTGAKEELSVVFSALDLEKQNKISCLNPYLLIQKENPDGSFTPVHRTEHVKKSVSPEWKKIIVGVKELCNGDYNRKLLVSCYDWKNGGDKLIGQFETNLRSLTRGPCTANEFKLINPAKKEKQKEKYKGSGTVKLQAVSVSSQFSFLDYIQGGCQIKVMVAIDYTKSNGAPSEPTSLHYSSPGSAQNQYARAIESVVGILEEYDSDKMIPAFGFGAITSRGFDEASHLFALNNNSKNPDCAGVAGVLNAYHDTLERVELFGPTCFAPSIRYAADEASQCMDGSQYCILLILTDGIIDDMPETKQNIIRASRLPLSIIIVGIGGEDFSAMSILDGDYQRLSHQKEVAVRDIVQFVAFRDFDPKTLNDDMKGQLLLAKEVLAEVPDQMISFMRTKNIIPKRRVRASTLV